jgi:ATP-dependent phosphofructokinase / diphosphate-dependent phosphofructokinase
MTAERPGTDARRTTTIGIVTGGGDAPGLNAVIRAVHRAASRRGMRVIGFADGYDGLLAPETARVLDYENTAGILGRGGTILGTSNFGKFVAKVGLGEGKTIDPALLAAARATLTSLGVEALVCIGGDGSMAIASQLSGAGIPTIGVPKTIDNDLAATLFTFGFESAVAVVTDALDRLHPTAYSHRRIMVVEVMGRHAGWIALYGGLAGGADVILLPEIPFDLDVVADAVRARDAAGRRFTMVVVAEGARPMGASVLTQQGGADREARLGGIGHVVTATLAERTGKEARCVVLGHLQRGGAPTSFDRVLATAFGFAAVDAIARREVGTMLALTPEGIATVPLAQAVAVRHVPADAYLIQVARGLGVSFGERKI